MTSRPLVRAWCLVLVLAMTACSGGSTGDATPTVAPTAAPDLSSAPVTEPATTEPATTEPAGTEAPTTEAPTTEAPATAGFQEVEPGGDCACADGSPFRFFVKEADPSKVMFFFQGGGACFSADTCAFDSRTYNPDISAADPSTLDGIFDTSNPENPLADWSVVYVPYCTGDVHIGNATTDYGGGLVVQHKGYVNGNAALDELARRFPDAQQVLVTGESAGSAPTPLYAGLVHDRLPDARITVLADGSGAYPDSPLINGTVGALWGTMNAVPDWPTNDDVTQQNWSLPGLFVRAGRHAPDITFARHDYAFDIAQTFYAALVGVAADDLVTLIDQNEDEIESAGVELDSYIAPGAGHTVLSSPQVYTEEVEGTRLIDWITELVEGRPVDDVHCTECEG